MSLSHTHTHPKKKKKKKKSCTYRDQPNHPLNSSFTDLCCRWDSVPVAARQGELALAYPGQDLIGCVIGTVGKWGVAEGSKSVMIKKLCISSKISLKDILWGLIDKFSFPIQIQQENISMTISLYHQVSDKSCTLTGNKLVDNSDVVGASPVGAAPTTSSFSTEHLASMDWAKTTARRDENLLSFGTLCVLY